MPLIIQPTDDSAAATAAALSRLVAAMLNMERGAREYSVVEGAVERAAPPAIGACMHHLVHRNLSDAAGFRFESEFNGEEFFLKDHAVPGCG